MIERLGPDFHRALMDLPATDYNIRWYHAYSTVAFLLANLSNFQFNRMWTFRSAGRTAWRAEYWPFLVVGLIGQGFGLALLTSLLHPPSPIALTAAMFGSASTRLYLAQLLVIGMITPLTFVLNKLWTFAAVRRPWPDIEVRSVEPVEEMAPLPTVGARVTEMASSADNVRA